jgi:membrane-bound lytic murein transglycosylase A
MQGGARRRGLSAAAVRAGLALTLAACATTPVAPPGPPETGPSGPAPTPDPAPAPEGLSPATLPGWNDEDHLAAFEAWALGCTVARDAASRTQCDRAMHIKQTSKPVTPTMARAFFESGFTVVAAETADGRPGMLTAYFAPEYAARRAADAEFDMPVLRRPEGWTRGHTLPVRAEIEATSPTDALAWMRA